jgi:hypothetical protein
MLAKLFSNGNLVAELEVEKPRPFVQCTFAVLGHDDETFLRSVGIVPDLDPRATTRTFKLTDVRTDLAIYDER